MVSPSPTVSNNNEELRNSGHPTTFLKVAPAFACFSVGAAEKLEDAKNTGSETQRQAPVTVLAATGAQPWLVTSPP